MDFCYTASSTGWQAAILGSGARLLCAGN